MPLKPRFDFGDDSRNAYQFEKKFTDRLESRRRFREVVINISSVQLEKRTISVIDFYGVGGIGKSRLLEELINVDATKIDDCITSEIDFDDPTARTQSRALLKLRTIFKNRFQVKFGNFDIAYSLYFKKKNPEFQYGVNSEVISQEVSLLGDILSVFEGLGFIGLIPKLINKSNELYGKFKVPSTIKKALEEFENLDIQSIEDRLIAFFAYDLKKHCSELKQLPVIFIDTYEKLWEERNSHGVLFTLDDWVREIVKSLPFALFVIMGREKLRWMDYEKDWDEVIEFCLLDRFTDLDSSAFLQSCRITDGKVLSRIISSSKGHPYYLDLSVDIYYQILSNGKRPVDNDFAVNKHLIFESFVRHLDSNEIEVLKVLSLTRYYTFELLEYLLKGFNIGYPVTRFDDLKRFSFIEQDGETFRIHSLMKKSLQDQLSDSLLNRINESIFLYYDSKLEKLSTEDEEDLIVKYLDETIWHKRQYETVEGLILWVESKSDSSLKSIQLKGNTDFLIDFLEQVKLTISPKALSLKLGSILIDMVHLQGRYKEAVAQIDGILKNVSVELQTSSDDYISLLIRKAHHEMFFLPIRQLLLRMENLLFAVDKRQFYERYVEILFMLGGNLGTLHGDYDYCLKYLNHAIKLARAYSLPALEIRSLRKYIDILSIRGHHKIAEQFYWYAKEKVQATGLFRYEIYLDCSYAEIMRGIGKYDLSRSVYLDALERANKQNIKGWIGHAHLGIAETFIDQKDFKRALEHLKNADKYYSIAKQIWGKVQVVIGIGRCKILEGVTPGKFFEEALRLANMYEYKRDEQYIISVLKENELLKNQLMFL